MDHSCSIALLTHNDRSVRLKAVELLQQEVPEGWLTDHFDVVVQLLRDVDAGVRVTAAELLRKAPEGWVRDHCDVVVQLLRDANWFVPFDVLELVIRDLPEGWLTNHCNELMQLHDAHQVVRVTAAKLLRKAPEGWLTDRCDVVVQLLRDADCNL
eukprot:659014-Amphidinium_carterae.1